MTRPPNGDRHPVKRELLRLLGGVALCAALVLAAFLALQAQLDRLQRVQNGFHTPALRLSAELTGALNAMTAPRGVAASAVERLDDEALFVAAVTRNFERAQALLAELLALHEHAPVPGFARAAQRLARARDELRTLDRSHREPLALARQVASRPVYASVVAQQTERLHAQASAALQRDQASAQRLFAGVFAFVCAGLGLALAVQLRRSLRGIDGLLAQERAAREHVGALLAAVPDLWFVLDAQGRFVEVSNPAHRDLAGTPWSALQGQPLRLVPPAAAPPPTELVLEPPQKQAQSLEYEVAADAGGPRAFEARLVPAGHDGWLYLSRDISERKRADLALSRSHEELERQVAQRTVQLTLARDAAEQANRAKSEFLSRMSHELRTPMNAVLGFAQLLGLDPDMPQQHRQSLDHILRAGKHLLHLINDVLDLAHVESGRLALSPEPLNVEDVVHEVMALMRPLAQSRQVALVTEPMSGSVVRGDRLRLKQVLLNLTANAVKYNNRPGGWVRLSTEAEADGRICIVVEDSGQGISPADLRRLFEPFTRLGADHGVVEGTGIGLSISKRLVELMDGRIGVDSEVGRGSRFWVALPADRLAPAPPPVAPALDAPAAADPPLARVLYVEDNPDNLELVMHIVARHPNVQLVSAPSAALGFDLARAEPPDLLLLDVHLPDGTGYQLLERLRAHEQTRAIPAVAITASAMPHDEARALAAGFADYLPKPIDVRRFDAMLRRMLGRR